MKKDLSVSYIINALQNSVESFEELALAVFNYQYTHNKVYQKYCNLINKTSAHTIEDNELKAEIDELLATLTTG